jgi:hypothetical protein
LTLDSTLDLPRALRQPRETISTEPICLACAAPAARRETRLDSMPICLAHWAGRDARDSSRFHADLPRMLRQPRVATHRPPSACLAQEPRA